MEEQAYTIDSRGIPLGDIVTNEGLHQHRDTSSDGFREPSEKAKLEEHIKELCAALKRGQQLEPITVKPSEHIKGKYEVLDGHHRIYALRQHKTKASCPIPCRVIIGASDREASELAFKENSRNKANLSREQKTEQAWKMLWRYWKDYEPIGAKKLEEKLLIGHTTIDKMKGAIKELTTDDDRAQLVRADSASHLKDILNDPGAAPPLWRKVRPVREARTPEDMDAIKKSAGIRAYISLLGAFGRTATLLREDEHEELINTALNGKDAPFRVVVVPVGGELSDHLRSRIAFEERFEF